MWINGKNTKKLGNKKKKTEVATWLSNNNSLNKWLNEIYSRRKNEWICYKRTGVWCKQVWFRRCFNISWEIFVKVCLSSIFYKKRKCWCCVSTKMHEESIFLSYLDKRESRESVGMNFVKFLWFVWFYWITRLKGLWRTL